MTIARQRLLCFALVGLLLAGGWFAYAPAMSGAFLLDDFSNLDGLRLVDDALSAVRFIFTGDAGPLGRPVALATFVPQAADWGENPEPFLIVNVLIHLANALLLARVAYLLASSRNTGNPLFVSLAAAGLWLVMPLLASSSLMIVQRMTTLSAFFVLLTLAAYLTVRRSIDNNPRGRLTWMSVILGAGTIVAAFTKENGALLPLFVLVIEATLLQRPAATKVAEWNAWKAAVLLLPTLLIVVFLLSKMPDSHDLVLRRGFTVWQRLLTESRILWEYLFNAFLPQPWKLGPFHDGYPVARTLLDPITFIAFVSWPVLSICALVWRRRFPLFSFAVLWYLAGHLLESTVLSLELYFEHRNYLPIFGPVFALNAAVARVHPDRRAVAKAGISVYAAVNVLVLFSVASLWGNPSVAAPYWAERFPNSVRAATWAATFRLQQDGLQVTLQSLRNLVREMPDAGYLKIQELNLACIAAPEGDHRGTIAELRELLPRAAFSITAATMLSQLFTTTRQLGCNAVDSSTVRMLAQTLMENPRYANSKSYRRLHKQLMASILRDQGELDRAVENLREAMAIERSSRINMMIVTTYTGGRDFAGARAYIEEARDTGPRHPVRAWLWQKDLDELSGYVDALQGHAANGPEAALP